MMDPDRLAKWATQVLNELGDDYKYEEFRALVREYYLAQRMKKFLKVGEYEDGK